MIVHYINVIIVDCRSRIVIDLGTQCEMITLSAGMLPTRLSSVFVFELGRTQKKMQALHGARLMSRTQVLQ